MQDLHSLSLEELQKLQRDVHIRIENLQNLAELPQTVQPRKLPQNFLELRKGDQIFGIQLTMGPHRLAEPAQLRAEIGHVDLCLVENISVSPQDPDWYAISITHPQHSWGISTSLKVSNFALEHCFLDMDTMRTGYDTFYTLRPAQWRNDLLRAFDYPVNIFKRRHEEDLAIFHSKLKAMLKGKDLINERIAQNPMLSSF